MRLTCEMRPEDYYPKANKKNEMARVNKPIRNKFEYRSTVFVAAGGDQRAIDRITNEFGKEGWESYAIDFINCIIYFKREITD